MFTATIDVNIERLLKPGSIWYGFTKALTQNVQLTKALIQNSQQLSNNCRSCRKGKDSVHHNKNKTFGQTEEWMGRQAVSSIYPARIIICVNIPSI